MIWAFRYRAAPSLARQDCSIAALLPGQIRSDEHLLRLSSDDREDEAGILRRQFSLTGREAEVLLWVARGKSNKDISSVLNISPRTVNKHLEQIFEKLGVENRASAAAITIATLHKVTNAALPAS